MGSRSPPMMDFPGDYANKDPDKANYQNYLAWQAETVQRRRHSKTQFNMYQCRRMERMSNQVQYKEEAERDSENLRDMIERRLSRACDCEACGDNSSSMKQSRSNSDASGSLRGESESPNGSSRSSMSSLSAGSPPGTMVRGPTSPSSRNSLIVSPPPRSRHHHRRRARTLPE